LIHAVAGGQVHTPVNYVRHRKSVFARSFGAARSANALFRLTDVAGQVAHEIIA
jgi:hypothetical protein